jgi:hypothetical protein
MAEKSKVASFDPAESRAQAALHGSDGQHYHEKGAGAAEW